MPELPEVETMRRGLLGIVGRTIAAARMPRGTVQPIACVPPAAALVRHLTGRTLAAVLRYGKRVVLETTAAGTPPSWLVIEPRMTGLMLVTAPPSEAHVRLVLDLVPTAGPPRVTFWDRRGLGTLRLVDAAGLERTCVAPLGPDALGVAATDLAVRLGPSRRAVKVALLDQRAVAGIGNIYASEILFRAGIDPRTRCRDLGAADWDRIARATRTILATAVRLEGSSIGDETYRTADSRPGRYQTRHRVYGGAGRACPVCTTAIRRFVQAQRSTFHCPDCQTRRPARRRRRGGRRADGVG